MREGLWLIHLLRRWGAKLINDGEIDFYQFIVSFMGVYFSGQATALAFSFAGSKLMRGRLNFSH
jgi:hypothetical protein